MDLHKLCRIGFLWNVVRNDKEKKKRREIMPFRWFVCEGEFDFVCRWYERCNYAQFSHRNPVFVRLAFDSRPTSREFFAPVFLLRATFFTWRYTLRIIELCCSLFSCTHEYNSMHVYFLIHVWDYPMSVHLLGASWLLCVTKLCVCVYVLLFKMIWTEHYCLFDFILF